MTKKKVDQNSFDFTDLAREDVAAAAADGQGAVMSRLGDISTLLKEKVEKEDKLAKLTVEAQKLQARIDTIGSTSIPDIFMELGFSKVTLTDGSKVEVKTEYAAGITEDKKVGCFDWLKKHGHDGLITQELSTKFKRGEEKLAKKVSVALAKLGVTFKDKSTVHPQTLKAFVKEQLSGEAAKDFPREQFSVFEIKKTIVSK